MGWSDILNFLEVEFGGDSPFNSDWLTLSSINKKYTKFSQTLSLVVKATLFIFTLPMDYIVQSTLKHPMIEDKSLLVNPPLDIHPHWDEDNPVAHTRFWYSLYRRW